MKNTKDTNDAASFSPNQHSSKNHFCQLSSAYLEIDIFTTIMGNPNYSACVPVQNHLTSDDSKIQFTMKVFPRVEFGSGGSIFKLQAVKLSEPVVVQYMISIVDSSQQKKLYSCVYAAHFLKEGEANFTEYINGNDLLDKKRRLFEDHKFRLLIEINIPENRHDLFSQSELLQFTHNFESLLKTSAHSDTVLLLLDNKNEIKFKIPLHKNILSVRSRVFEQMFEQSGSRLKVPDMSLTVCMHLLSYIYTGKICMNTLKDTETRTENVKQLLAASDKFQLEHLKDICQQYLSLPQGGDKDEIVNQPTFLWKSNAFNDLLIRKSNRHLVSTFFCIDNCGIFCSTPFKLPNLHKEDDDKMKFTFENFKFLDSFCVRLCAVKLKRTEEFSVQFSVSILDRQKEKRYSKMFWWNFTKVGDANYGNLIKLKDLFCLNNQLDRVQLLIEIDIPDERFDLSSQAAFDKIAKDYKTLLDSGKLSDAVLAVEGKEIRVHKNILTTRSSYFAAMFTHDYVENQSNRVHISDMSFEVCQIMLTYLYTGKVLNSLLNLENSIELLIASEMYQLAHLKSTCEHYLSSSLTVESVSDILVLADLYNALELHTKCLDFITINEQDVLNTEGWKHLIATKPVMRRLLFNFKMRQNVSKNVLNI